MSELTLSTQATISPKLKDYHLARLAIVYVRQSSPQQVVEHRESTARQYALTDRAATGGVFLMHPNLIEHFGATDAFHAWIDEFQPTTVSGWVEDGGVGLLVDAVRPLKIE